MSGPVVRGTAADPQQLSDNPWWHTATWWAASVLVALLHNGLWATPNLAFVSLISRNPGENPFGGTLAGDYLLTDVSLTRLAWLTGQTQPHEVARLHLVVLVVGWAAVVALARSRFGHAAARNLTVILAASPLVTVSMQWLGQPDPLTGLCGLAMVLARRRTAVVALGVLAGITHPEQAVFMAGLAGVVRCFLPAEVGAGAEAEADVERPAPSTNATEVAGWVASAVGGVLIGWIVVQLWFRVSDITLSTPRSDYLSYGLSTFWEHHLTQPVGLFWTLWGPLWLVILLVVGAGLQRHLEGAKAWRLMALLAFAALVPVFITLDETRVYAVITAPLLAAGAMWVGRSWPAPTTRNVAVALLVLTAVIPGGFATGSTSWRSQLDTATMAAFLANGSIEGDYPAEADITPWLLSPFDFAIPDPPQ